MNNMIMSTKKTTTAFTTVRMVLAVIGLIIGFVALIAAWFLADVYPKLVAPKIIFLILGAVFMVKSFLDLFNAGLEGKTYVDVYEGRIVGVGRQGFRVMDFNVKTESVNNVTVERGIYLHINTRGGTYKVTTNKETAEKIYNHFAELVG